jgi:hypothetical protein
MATVNSDISPMALLDRFRGSVTDARVTYPERAAIDLTDAEGGEWHLTTWWADYDPPDPAACGGKTVVRADLGEPSGTLTLRFSDGSAFTITPARDERDDAIENWELFTPEGFVLAFGPRGRWQLLEAGTVR